MSSFKVKEWVLRRNNNKLARKNGHMRIPEQEWQGKNIFVWEVLPVDLNFFGTFFFVFVFFFHLPGLTTSATRWRHA